LPTLALSGHTSVNACPTAAEPATKTIDVSIAYGRLNAVAGVHVTGQSASTTIGMHGTALDALSGLGA